MLTARSPASIFLEDAPQLTEAYIFFSDYDFNGGELRELVELQTRLSNVEVLLFRSDPSFHLESLSIQAIESAEADCRDNQTPPYCLVHHFTEIHVNYMDPNNFHNICFLKFLLRNSYALKRMKVYTQFQRNDIPACLLDKLLAWPRASADALVHFF